MARLIDADKISYERAHLIYPDGRECLGYRAVASSVEIKAAPTVDAVEVVRCKDCKHSKLPAVLTQKYGEPGTLTCHNWHSPCNKRNINQDDFCSYGERKDGDGNG